jgi:hypothetical protein
MHRQRKKEDKRGEKTQHKKDMLMFLSHFIE